MKKRILTGDRPTGPMHIGHYVGSLENRVRLQEEYDCFFIIADYQFLTDHLKETEKTRYFVNQVLLDWLSIGMSPEKSTFFIQSMIPEIAELTMYFSMLVSVARLQRNPTVKEEFKAAGLRAMSYGFLGYPISQAADILIVRADTVPVGDDNLPHVEQTREVARTFNRTFGEVFPVPEALVGRVDRLPGLDGQKMGNSAGNAIYLVDSPDEVRQKISAAITDPARIKASDRGHPDICNIYKYHLAFNDSEAPEIDQHCRLGKMGCVICKQKIAEVINTFLEPIREKRAFYEVRPAIIKDAIQNGNEKTRGKGRETIRLVREVMHYDYRDLIEGEKIAV
ncbi:tryptophan--tRNA ligase [Chloroflexota bacterium]